MPPFGVMVRRGVRRRCPQCGSRQIFSSRYRLRERCPDCGLHAKQEEGHELGGITMNLVATLSLMLIVLLFFAVVTWPDVPVVPMVAITLAIAVLVPVLCYPMSKTLWLAIELKAKEAT